MKTTLLTAALTLLAATANAGTISHSSFQGRVDFEVVTTMTSTAGEVQNDFLVRVARELQSYTAKTGFEACGKLAMSIEGNYAVTITTNKSQIGCLVTVTAPKGYSFTPLGIHSHPQVEQVRLNKNDVVFRGAFTHKLHDRETVLPDDFSDTDYDSGAGYLVTGGKLLYQYGRGTAKVIAVL